LEPLGGAAATPDAAPELAIAACPPGFAESGGACRRPDAPHQCQPGDAAACEAQCTAGHAGSCATLAVMLRDGIGVTKDWGKAAKLAETACTQDVPAACRVLAAAKLGGQGTKK